MTLERDIEAVLFYKAEPMRVADLAAFFSAPENEVQAALTQLRERLIIGATRLIEIGGEVQLVSAPEVAAVIERLRADELSREIGKAGAETLAIVLYRGPVTRAAVDHIRGVNSAFILRNLTARGLVIRVPHKTLARSFSYEATPELLAHLGVTRKEELPDYAAIMGEIDAFEQVHTTESVSSDSAPGDASPEGR